MTCKCRFVAAGPAIILANTSSVRKGGRGCALIISVTRQYRRVVFDLLSEIGPTTDAAILKWIKLLRPVTFRDDEASLAGYCVWKIQE